MLPNTLNRKHNPKPGFREGEDTRDVRKRTYSSLRCVKSLLGVAGAVYRQGSPISDRTVSFGVFSILYREGSCREQLLPRMHLRPRGVVMGLQT